MSIFLCSWHQTQPTIRMKLLSFCKGSATKTEIFSPQPLKRQKSRRQSLRLQSHTADEKIHISKITLWTTKFTSAKSQSRRQNLGLQNHSADGKIYICKIIKQMIDICKIIKTVLSELYYIKNSNTRGQPVQV